MLKPAKIAKVVEKVHNISHSRRIIDCSQPE